VPIYPVKGYTLTVPAAPWPEAPKLPILDEARKFGMVRFGDRLRAAGSAEITGYDTVYNERRASAILKSATELFPDFKRCLDPATVRPWCGLRPFTPDGPPVLGRTPYRGLFLNAGHGHLGWTLSCGSGKALAEIVVGRDPGLDLEGLTLARYRQ
jgi:D-amino-acid dehydrogenase